MPSRRAFFKTVAGAAAGLAVADQVLAGAGHQAPPPIPGKRREVFVGGKRVKVIDMHCHCVVPEVAEVIKGTPLEAEAKGGGACFTVRITHPIKEGNGGSNSSG